MIYCISDCSLDEGVRLCIDKAKRLACGAELIMKNEGCSSHALVLYEFAIEEYGKGELLGDCKSKRHSSGECCVHKSIFYDHQKTTIRALESLPDDCKKIDLGVSLSIPFDATTYIQKNVKRLSRRNSTHSNGSILSIPPYVTGLFTSVGLHIEKNRVNLEKNVRWPALYVDWDDENKTWRHEFIPDVDRLSNAISSFKKHLDHIKMNVDRK